MKILGGRSFRGGRIEQSPLSRRWLQSWSLWWRDGLRARP